MFNTSVVALVPFKSHCYLKKNYFAADTIEDIGQVSPLTYFRNRDIVYIYSMSVGVTLHHIRFR